MIPDMNALNDSLQILADDSSERFYTGEVSPAIFQTSIFTHPNVAALRSAMEDEAKGLLYSRGNNPTVRLCEKKLAALEGGEDARLFASGVSAAAAAVLSHVKSGDHAICTSGAYGWSRYLFQDYLSRFGVEYDFCDGSDAAEFEPLIRKNTKLIFLESPSSMKFHLQDLGSIASLARSKGITTVIDNTWASPLYQNPLAFGIDLVIHSASKYISGHSDVVAGAVIGDAKRMDRIFKTELTATGGIVSPLQAWLILRGMRTLGVRLPQHSRNTAKVLDFFDQHPAIEKINYPLHRSHPQYELAKKQLKGGSGLLSFQLRDRKIESIERFVDALKIPRIGVSWGGYESLIFPAIAKLKQRSGTVDENTSLIRLHVGLEPPQSLIADLEQALATVQ